MSFADDLRNKTDEVNYKNSDEYKNQKLREFLTSYNISFPAQYADKMLKINKTALERKAISGDCSYDIKTLGISNVQKNIDLTTLICAPVGDYTDVVFNNNLQYKETYSHLCPYSAEINTYNNEGLFLKQDIPKDNVKEFYEICMNNPKFFSYGYEHTEKHFKIQNDYSQFNNHISVQRNADSGCFNFQMIDDKWAIKWFFYEHFINYNLIAPGRDSVKRYYIVGLITSKAFAEQVSENFVIVAKSMGFKNVICEIMSINTFLQITTTKYKKVRRYPRAEYDYSKVYKPYVTPYKKPIKVKSHYAFNIHLEW